MTRCVARASAAVRVRRRRGGPQGDLQVSDHFVEVGCPGVMRRDQGQRVESLPGQANGG